MYAVESVYRRLVLTALATAIPEKLKVAVIDDKGEEVLYTTSRQNDHWMEVEFSAQFGEKFSIELILGESKVTQEFIV